MNDEYIRLSLLLQRVRKIKNTIRVKNHSGLGRTISVCKPTLEKLCNRLPSLFKKAYNFLCVLLVFLIVMMCAFLALKSISRESCDVTQTLS